MNVTFCNMDGYKVYDRACSLSSAGRGQAFTVSRGIGHGSCLEIQEIIRGVPNRPQRAQVPPDNASRDAHCGRVRRDIAHHDRIGTDARPITDRDRADNLRTRTDEHVVAEPWTLPALRANGDLVLDGDVRAGADLAVDHDT